MAKKLSKRARAQRDHLMEVTYRVAVRSVFLLRDRGWTADQIATQMGLMIGAAGNAVITDAGTNAEIDGDTGEFTPESLDRTVDVDAYAGCLVDEVCKEGVTNG